ncbi:MAG: FHA domain-containing protein [Spartobacteria bacterium]|nr:FHA domain-containing protein [Spartobacteria bacterium]
MRLRYSKKDGTQMEFELGERPITIGRSPEADVVILDERTSRVHCGVRFWDGDFYVKDLKSRNGTYVNEEQVDVAKLHVGDRIQIGSVVMLFEREPVSVDDPDKGYYSILREIVDVIEKPEVENLRAQETLPGTDEPIRIITRRKKRMAELAEDEF